MRLLAWTFSGKAVSHYRTKEMLFGPKEFFTAFATDTLVVTIRMQFQSRLLRLVVDTGGPDLMLFQSRLPGIASLPVLEIENVADVSGTFQRRQVRISGISLGKQAIGPPDFMKCTSIISEKRRSRNQSSGFYIWVHCVSAT
jgi:hypothetical protein